MTNTPSAERRIIAHNSNFSSTGRAHIHEESTAKEHGYQGALVVGGFVYGWAAPTILSQLGTTWLDHGWSNVSFRRPTYVGDELTFSIAEGEAGSYDFGIRNQKGETVAFGQVGLGDAPWLPELVLPTRIQPEARLEEREPLTLENAPVGQDLRPSASRAAADASWPYILNSDDENNPMWMGSGSRVHPGWVIGRMTGLQLNTYTFSPSIAAGIRIQHLARFEPDQAIIVAGHFSRAYERNGHHHSVVDGLIIGEQGQHLLRVQQDTLFMVGKRG